MHTSTLIIVSKQGRASAYIKRTKYIMLARPFGQAVGYIIRISTKQKCLWIGRVYLHGFVKNKLSKCKNVVLNKPEISYGYLTPPTLPPFFILLYISQFFF